MEPPETRYHYVYNTLRSRILSGQLLPGSRLPSSRMLCQEFQVGMPAITKALHALKADGLIEIHPRRVPIVCLCPQEEPSSSVISSLLEQHDSILQIYHSFILILPSMLTFASQNCDIHMLPHYRQALRAARRGAEPNGWRSASALCTDILRSSGNPLTVELYGFFELHCNLTFFTEQCPYFQNHFLPEGISTIGELLQILSEHDSSRRFQRLTELYQKLDKAVEATLTYYSQQQGKLPEQVPLTFHWNPTHRKDYYYMQILQDLLRKIDMDEYPAGSLLPSESAMAAHYNVSVSTVRAALSRLRDMGLAYTVNGKGTIVQAPNPSSTLQTLTRTPDKQDILLHLYALQLMILLLYPAALYTAPRLTVDDRNILSEYIQTENALCLKDILSLLMNRLDILPLHKVLTETASLTDWGFYLTICLKEKYQTNQLLNKLCQSAVQNLRQQNYEGFAERLADCYRYILDTIRQYLVDKRHIWEAQSVRTPLPFHN